MPVHKGSAQGAVSKGQGERRAARAAGRATQRGGARESEGPQGIPKPWGHKERAHEARAHEVRKPRGAGQQTPAPRQKQRKRTTKKTGKQAGGRPAHTEKDVSGGDTLQERGRSPVETRARAGASSSAKKKPPVKSGRQAGGKPSHTEEDVSRGDTLQEMGRGPGETGARAGASSSTMMRAIKGKIKKRPGEMQAR